MEDKFPFQNYSIISLPVNTLFNSRFDKWFPPAQFYISELLERGVNTLVFAGIYDSVCAWPSNRMEFTTRSVLGLPIGCGSTSWPWSGSLGFQEQEWRSWEMEGKQAGDIKSFGPLTLASVWGAGHMVKYSLAIGIDKQLISNFHRRRMISPRKFFRWCQGWMDRLRL